MAGESPLRCWPSGVDAIGVPSTGLSLGGLLASRARFRFTDIARIELLPGPAKGTIIEP